MSSVNNKQQLHWTQRVALLRHNLHVASRSGDFTFFKTLQAAGLMEGTNHVATLSSLLGDDADSLLAGVDNLNTGLAYVHQDAFKNVYDSIKNSLRDDNNKEADKSKLYVDMTMQRNVADMAIDKVTTSAITLINQQPAHVQDEAANVWISGATIIADCVEVALKEIDELEDKMDDFIRMEEGWNRVKASVVGAITGLKGIFVLMDPNSPQSEKTSPRSSSIASASSAMLRRLSNAWASHPTTHSRQSSIASTNSNLGPPVRNGSVSSINSQVYRTPNYLRSSVSNGCPTSMPATGHKLSTIPPTPAREELVDPFDTNAPPMPAIPAIPAAVVVDQQRRLIQTVM